MSVTCQNGPSGPSGQEYPMGPFRARPLPLVVEAFLWQPGSSSPLPSWAAGSCREENPGGRGPLLWVEGGQCRLVALPGDFLVLGADGHVSPVRAEVFYRTYELAPAGGVKPESEGAT